MKNECYVGKVAKSGEFKEIFWKELSCATTFCAHFCVGESRYRRRVACEEREKEKLAPPANFTFEWMKNETKNYKRNLPRRIFGITNG